MGLADEGPQGGEILRTVMRTYLDVIKNTIKRKFFSTADDRQRQLPMGSPEEITCTSQRENTPLY